MVTKLKPDLSHKLRKLDLGTRRLISTKLLGKYKSLIKGRGLEFSSFREYSLQDDASLIDWKASLRAHEPLIKEFVEERNLEVFFLIDVSASMLFGSTQKLKNEFVIELAALLSYAVISAGDNLGYAFFSNRLFNTRKPSRNPSLFYFLTSELLKTEIYGNNFD